MEKYDVVIAGGGHAGIEAALAVARLGLKTVLITQRKGAIGKMSCNPAIGGLAKGHLVREIDALGGEMAKIIDQTGIHFKLLNQSKGPAVWSPRAQADRKQYMLEAQKRIFAQENLFVIEGAVSGLRIKNNKITGAILTGGSVVPCQALILSCGTFLNGKIHIGLNNLSGGRAGENSINGLTDNLIDLGFRAGRLKTGTPPRVHVASIDFKYLQEQKPDDAPIPFSFETEKISRKQLSCFITHTNSTTHALLKSGLDRSPIYMGVIKALGPRYCPSVEDKIVRFPDKDRHQIFLEPESFESPEVYVNGFSTSLPSDIQERAIRTIKGLKYVEILRLGYAVEYDFFPSYQLQPTLETKIIENLYFAGQINGTSGYEEAAAQGLIAGINAALKLKELPPFVLSRSEAYIGVLIDDLINKTILEPYRMFTSRAEFRLLLRHDNADLRLMERGYKIGLISNKAFDKMNKRKTEINKLKNEISTLSISPEFFNTHIKGIDDSEINQATPLPQLLKRPGVKLEKMLDLPQLQINFSKQTIAEVEFLIKYEGFLNRQQMLVDKFKKMEHTRIPEWIDFGALTSLSTESRESLSKIRPQSLGQAARISGVRQSDLTILMLYIEKGMRNRPNVSRETVTGNR